MTTDLVVSKKYAWKGLTVCLKHLAGGTATISPDGSSHVIFVGSDELSPLPRKGETASLAMQVSEAEWTRAVGLADEFKNVLSIVKGKTEAMATVAKCFKLSTRAAYNLLKRYRRDPSPYSLLRSLPGRKLGSRVLTAQRETIIADAITEIFLKPEKPNVAVIHGDIKILCEKVGLPAPSAGTIRKRIASIDLETRLALREGKRHAQETCAPAPGHLSVTRPLERVEIDHTLVDCMLVSDTKARKVLGRPWVTIAVDCCTRMVLGFYISFERPSSMSVALCIAHVILPKDEWLKAHGVPGSWPCLGFPEAIWVDNALEFRALALRRGCETYQIKLCYRPPGEPQVGGTIERLIGTLMGRVHVLPGTTQSNVSERGAYNSEKKAQLTLREFVTWFTSEVVTQYHTTNHRGIGKPPLVAWNQSFEHAPPVQAGVPLEVLASFLPGKSRVLRRTGVDLHRNNYWSDAFSPWTGQKLRVAVHNYPLDLEHVYVRLPNGELTVATAKHSKPTAARTVLDHLMQATEDRQLENDPELKRVRQDGHALKNDILKTSTQAAKAGKQAQPRMPDATAPTPELTLFRPQRTGAAIIHFNGDKQ